jgi:hypothetical protein
MFFIVVICAVNCSNVPGFIGRIVARSISEPNGHLAPTSGLVAPGVRVCFGFVPAAKVSPRILDHMPRRELKSGAQVDEWLKEMAGKLTQSGKMILIGSGGLLWHAFIQGITTELPEASMDVDPITDSDEIARFCYDSLIGSEFNACMAGT